LVITIFCVNINSNFNRSNGWTRWPSCLDMPHLQG
jgi:hypothetical protein